MGNDIVITGDLAVALNRIAKLEKQPVHVVLETLVKRYQESKPTALSLRLPAVYDDALRWLARRGRKSVSEYIRVRISDEVEKIKHGNPSLRYAPLAVTRSNDLALSIRISRVLLSDWHDALAPHKITVSELIRRMIEHDTLTERRRKRLS